MNANVISRGRLCPGNIVRPSAGGMDMVVEAVRGREVDCVWFEGTACLRGTFPTAVLRRSDGPAISGTIAP